MWRIIACITVVLIALPMPSFAQTKKETPPDKAAAPSIDRDEKIQAARERYFKEEGAGKRGPRFFELAVRLLGPAARRRPPIPDEALLRYLGKPDLLGYTGTKDAKGKWTEKVTNYAYVVDNKNGRTLSKDLRIAVAEKITVIAAVRAGHLVGVGFVDGGLKESPGLWEKYKK